MLNEIEVLNLKSIDKALLKLAPLTVLTGVNSSGKSTVIQALMLLIKYSDESNRYSMEELIRYLGDFSSIRNKKVNARSIDIRVTDTDSVEHNISIQTNDVERNSTLRYLYEGRNTEAVNELFYLNANRIGAQELVPSSERKVGNIGEFLFSSFEKIKGKALPPELIKFEGSKTIAYQLSQWLSFITCSPTELVTEKLSDQVKVSFLVKDIDSNVSPFNLGAGMSYVAKVLIICLMAKKGDLVLLENPEVQLHPKTQALLGVFLTFISSKGIQLIIETHCEHLINKIAYQIYEDEIDAKDVVIHYKPSVSESFQTILIDENGEFNDEEGNVQAFPAGFFDATLADLMKMR
ncbi:MAG: putative ATPase [Patiriisocius sp.]|jgi:predicted ATPase